MDTNQLKCAMCGAQSNSQEELDLHAKQMHSKTEEHTEDHAIMCSKCGVKVNTQPDMEKHKSETMSDAQHKMA